jgi:uncharacterized membrane protein
MEAREGRLDDLVGRLLIVGSGIALALMAAGLGLYLAALSAEQPARGSPDGMLAGIRDLNPIEVTYLGVLILMATPVARVVALVVGFWWEGRPCFALISLLVLALLFTSFVFVAG